MFFKRTWFHVESFFHTRTQVVLLFLSASLLRPPRSRRPRRGSFEFWWCFMSLNWACRSPWKGAGWLDVPLDLGRWGHVSSSAWAWVAPGSAYLHLSLAGGSLLTPRPPDPYCTNYLTYPPKTDLLTIVQPNPHFWDKQSHLQAFGNWRLHVNEGKWLMSNKSLHFRPINCRHFSVDWSIKVNVSSSQNSQDLQTLTHTQSWQFKILTLLIQRGKFT